jgi:hypothetical protein
MSASERARSEQLLAAFKANPNVLAVLDSVSGPPSVTSLAPATGRPNTTSNGTDGNTIAPPSATQR